MMSYTLFVPEHILICLEFSIAFKANKTSKYFYDVPHIIVFKELIDGLKLYFYQGEFNLNLLHFG